MGPASDHLGGDVQRTQRGRRPGVVLASGDLHPQQRHGGTVTEQPHQAQHAGPVRPGSTGRMTSGAGTG